MGNRLRWTIFAGAIVALSFQNCDRIDSTIPGVSNLPALNTNGTLALPSATAPLGITAVDSSTVVEGILRVEIRLNKQDVETIMVSYSTENGVAATPAHFLRTDGTIAIPAGQLSAVVEIPVLKSEAAPVAFGLRINSVSKGAIDRALAVLTIPVNSVHDPIVQKVAASQHHTCALTSTKSLKCWGMGVKAPPFEVAGLTELTQVTGTDRGSCVLKSPGTAFCWAYSYGSYAVAPVASLTGMKQVLLGPRPCVLTAENTVSCGLLSALTPFPGLVGIRQVSSGWLHSCVLTAQNTVLCWGENQVGQLGNGTGLASTQPVLVPGLSRIKQISTGDSHT